MTNSISKATEYRTSKTISTETISSIYASTKTDSREYTETYSAKYSTECSAREISDDRYFLRGKRFRS